MDRIKNFGATVKRLRAEKGLTQEALAERSGLHINTISFVERGMVTLTLDSICALADAFEVKVSDLMVRMEAPLPKSRSKSK